MPDSGEKPAENEPVGAAGETVPTAPQRDRPWLFWTYAGHSTAAASNALFRNNLSRGQTGLSVAFDLPTQTGYDSDHPLAKGEVGKIGVPVCHLGDLRALFEGIPLERMNTSMTINATAALAARALRRAGRGAGDRAGRARRHHPERYPEGISGARHLHLPARAVAQIDRRYHRLRLPRSAALEPGQRLLLPFAGGRRDAGPGTGLRARQRDRDPGCGEGRRPGARGRLPPRWSGACPFSSTPACASSPSCARCAPSWCCGTRSAASATA